MASGVIASIAFTDSGDSFMEAQDIDLQSIEKTLQEKALQLEQARLLAHENAMKEIAESKTLEEKKRKAVQDNIDAQEAIHLKRKEEAKTFAAETAAEELRLKLLKEQEQNRRLSEVDAMVVRREAMAKKLLEMEHAEELAKKELRDLILSSTMRVDSEHVMDNPLQRFLQPKE
jgi:prephenate dehydratase